MNKQDYLDYKQRVAAFFEREHLANLSSGRITCERCKTELNREEDFPFCPNNECPDFKKGVIDEPFFSWRRCECCGTNLGGNRVDASGYDTVNKEVREFVVCEDCVYYAEYGRLDDATMDAIEACDDDEVGEDDYTTTDHIHWYQYGKLVLTTNVETCEQELLEHMRKENFFPNAFWLSDHGNAHRITLTHDSDNTK